MRPGSRPALAVDEAVYPPQACNANFGHGVASVSFRLRGRDSVLDGLYQKDPLRVLFPRVAGDEPVTAVLLTTSGGLVGGDTLKIAVAVDKNARALVTTQAAEKIYRSAGPQARIETRLRVEPGAWLEWLPQETILFDRARLARRIRVEVEPTGRFLGGEVLVCGRTAYGESLREGSLLDRWDVFFGERLAWVDALRLDGDIEALLSGPAGFAGSHVLATIVYVAADAGARLQSARALLPQRAGLRVAATCIGEVLIVRWLGMDAFDMRHAYGEFWAAFRAEIAALPPRLPRLWNL